MRTIFGLIIRFINHFLFTLGHLSCLVDQDQVRHHPHRLTRPNTAKANNFSRLTAPFARDWPPNSRSKTVENPINNRAKGPKRILIEAILTPVLERLRFFRNCLTCWSRLTGPYDSDPWSTPRLSSFNSDRFLVLLNILLLFLYQKWVESTRRS